jgi:pantetheine-phosphate adenylyltransferase
MSIAIYAGTFDPFTLGHKSIVKIGARMYSHVRVLVATNPNKKTLFSETERIATVSVSIGGMPNVSVDSTDGYVVRYAQEIGASVLIRGIRNVTDAAYELKLAQENKKLAPEIQTVFLPADPALSDLSSSQVKELLEVGVDISTVVVPAVAMMLNKKIATIREMKDNGHA